MKLSHRLRCIEQMVATDYRHIWDCCCDHGLLGAALLSRAVLSRSTSSHIHFVDIVPELMGALDKRLSRFYPDGEWQTHCLDVAQLPLAKYTGRQLVIIAGVGGDLITHFVETIYRQHPTLAIDFLLCPVHHHYSLRQMLIKRDFSLQQERLVEENQRFYEILLVSSAGEGSKKISPIGNEIWQFDSRQQEKTVRRYLAKTLQHYQRIQQGQKLDVQHIIDAYHRVDL
ncbi:MAG: tRNA (adenine(22)-N(1))-methyltransferase [Plesiomonas shigelloides]